jgi:hypothetical protein
LAGRATALCSDSAVNPSPSSSTVVCGLTRSHPKLIILSACVCSVQLFPLAFANHLLVELAGRRTKPDAVRPPSTSTSRTPSQAGSAGSTSHRRHGTNGGARPGHHDVTRKCAPTQSRSQQREHSSTPSAAAARAAKAALAVTVVHSPRAPRASCPAKSDSESPSAAAPIPVARPVPQYYSGVQFVSMSHLCYCCCYCCCICCSPLFASCKM